MASDCAVPLFLFVFLIKTLVYRKNVYFTLENAMLKRGLQSAGGRVGDFFAGDMLSLLLKKRKVPILAHFSLLYTQK
jgi:hypothetical protein